MLTTDVSCDTSSSSDGFVSNPRNTEPTSDDAFGSPAEEIAFPKFKPPLWPEFIGLTSSFIGNCWISYCSWGITSISRYSEVFTLVDCGLPKIKVPIPVNGTASCEGIPRTNP